MNLNSNKFITSLPNSAEALIMKGFPRQFSRLVDKLFWEYFVLSNKEFGEVSGCRRFLARNNLEAVKVAV